MIKQGTIILNVLLSILFFYYQCQAQQTNNLFTISRSSLIFVCPILQILVTLIHPFCYKGHCKPPHHFKNSILKLKYSSQNALSNDQFTRKKSLQFQFPCEVCQDCEIPKYIRMKHCYRCKRCVHKYDHHCVLLNVCIGQANQKYYFLYLWFMLYNTILVIKNLLVWIDNEIYMDENGIEHISVKYFFEAIGIIILSLILILVCYLTFIHTCFVLAGETTYQSQRRQIIPYFKHFRKNIYRYLSSDQIDKIDVQKISPFNYGPINNIKKVFQAGTIPIDWRLTNNNYIDLQKQNSKSLEEWGRQSSSHLVGHQTTKSRDSANYLQLLDKMANKS